MCGIAGYLGTVDIPEGRLQAALSTQRRRGPDHQAVYRGRTADGRRVILLHTRLAIIDLDSRANQPFRFGDSWLVYNGELYNYLELRVDLQKEGIVFQTTSDTEVLAAGLARYGEDFLDRCEGMWAFAWYNEKDGSLLLARDRFGEKPLVIHRSADGLYFASEAKAIVALRGRRFSPNLNQVRRFLVNGYRALFKTGERFLEGVEDLPPGEALQIRPNGAEVRRRYWSFRFEPDESMTYEDAVHGVRCRLERAVRWRLRADVPLAFCLSGGVDSNAVVALAKHVCGHEVHAFSIINTDTRYEERDLIETSVSHLGIRHTPVALQTEGFLKNLRRVVRYHEAPVATVSYYAHWLLLREVASAGYRIAVSGTAGDELFSGYYDHHLMYLREVHIDPAYHAAARAAWERRVRPHVRNPHLSDPDRFLREPTFRDHLYFGAEVFSRRLTAPWSEPFTESHYTNDLLRNRMLNELFEEVVPVILYEDDRNAMFFSIENRTPLLDRGLFEFSLRIPTRHLIRDGLAKAVLRDVVSDLVAEPIRRSERKVGFNAPVFDLLDRRSKEVRDEVLGDSPIYDHVRREAIESLLDQSVPSDADNKFLFSFLSSKMFLEEFA